MFCFFAVGCLAKPQMVLNSGRSVDLSGLVLVGRRAAEPAGVDAAVVKFAAGLAEGARRAAAPQEARNDAALPELVLVRDLAAEDAWHA